MFLLYINDIGENVSSKLKFLQMIAFYTKEFHPLKTVT